MKICKCPRCGAGGAVYGETSGEYINHITCSNLPCGFTAYGEWIEDPTVFERWAQGIGDTLKDRTIEWYDLLGEPTPDFLGRYWRGDM